MSTEEPQQSNNDNGNNKRKRKRDKSVNHYATAYQGVQYELVEKVQQLLQIPGVPYPISTCAPGSPGRLFAASYRVNFLKNLIDDTTPSSSLPSACQVVHHHVNGLCLVTLGNILEHQTSKLERIEFLTKEATSCSANARRKQQSKMLRKGNNANKNNKDDKNDDTITGIVTPHTPIARLHFQPCGDNASNKIPPLPIHAGVWGTLLEINHSATVQQLQSAPLMEGYLAVILPTGHFPPRECLVNSKADANEAEATVQSPDDPLETTSNSNPNNSNIKER